MSTIFHKSGMVQHILRYHSLKSVHSYVIGVSSKILDVTNGDNIVPDDWRFHVCFLHVQVVLVKEMFS